MDVVPVKKIRPVRPLERQSGQIPYPLGQRGHFLALLAGHPVDGNFGGRGCFDYGWGLQKRVHYTCAKLGCRDGMSEGGGELSIVYEQ